MGTYTDSDAIARRLTGWAQVNAPATDFAETTITSDLIDQLIEQAEARVNRCLALRYTLPINGNKAYLAGIVEKLVLCQLLQQIFAGENPTQRSSYDHTICAQGERELKELKDDGLPDQPLNSAIVSTPDSGLRNVPSVYSGPTSGSRRQKHNTQKTVRW